MRRDRTLLLANVGVLASLLGACGLRTDPDTPGLCPDAADTEGDTEDTDGEIRFLSCEDPLYLVSAPGTRVEGVVGGCGDTQGWCDANGGEDYFWLVPPAGFHDGSIRFDPAATDFEPIVRVIDVPIGGDPCAEVPIENEPVCVQVSDEHNPRSFLLKPEFHTFVIVDSNAGDGGNYAFTLDFGIGAGNGVDCLVDLEEQPITLGPGGVFTWQGNLDAGQGVLSGQCGGPGEDDVFALTVNAPGTLTATLTSDGGAVVSLRAGCASGNEMACNADAGTGTAALQYVFAAPGTAYVWVDQTGVEASSYQLEVRLD
jgi:hypothetical protein